MDARVKFIFTLAFIVCLNLIPYNAWLAYSLFLVLALSLVLLSKLGGGLVLKRSLIALPFALAALPLIFTSPPPALTLHILPGWAVQCSLEGIERFISILLRSWISIQAAILLASTTRFNDLMTALQQLKLPGLLVSVISLMWRYLFVIIEEVARMLRARNARSSSLPGKRPGGSVLWRARVTGGMAGSLFLRSLERSDRVYSAMLSRGYSGELPVGRSLPMTGLDRRTLLSGLFLLLLLSLFGFLIGG
jgi:cobalt/nickel transport system permease protein